MKYVNLNGGKAAVGSLQYNRQVSMELAKTNMDFRLNTFMISGIVFLVLNLVERELRIVIWLLGLELLHSQILFLTLSFAIMLFFTGVIEKIRLSIRSMRSRNVTSILTFFTVFPLITIALLTIAQNFLVMQAYYYSNNRDEHIWHVIMNEANALLTISFLIFVAAQIVRVVELIVVYKNSGRL